MGGDVCRLFTTFSRFTCLCYKLLLVPFVDVTLHIPQQLNIKMAVLLLRNEGMLAFLYSYNTYKSLKVK